MCRADQMQSNGPTLRSVANFHMSYAVHLRRHKPVYEHRAFQNAALMFLESKHDVMLKFARVCAPGPQNLSTQHHHAVSQLLTSLLPNWDHSVPTPNDSILRDKRTGCWQPCIQRMSSWSEENGFSAQVNSHRRATYYAQQRKSEIEPVAATAGISHVLESGVRSAFYKQKKPRG